MSVNLSAYLSRAATASEAGDFREALKAMTHVVATQAQELAKTQHELRRVTARLNRVMNSLVRAGVEVL